MYVLTVCSVNVTNRVDPIEVFKLACTGRVISSRRFMVYMSKFILIYGLLELFGICLLALESILFFNRIYRNYFVNNFVTTGTLVVPEWNSAPFWPIIHTGFKFRAFIKKVKVFKGYNITHRGRGRNGIFGTPHQNFNFLALRFEP